jgi:RNA polymerase sigma-70 factor (ECF subfamily)
VTPTEGDEVRKRQDLESTKSLIARLRGGDESARNKLLQRYVPIFRRWAHGRLPGYARDITETDDLVQLSVIRALKNIDHFEVKREGAFLAYLRTILMNLVRDEIGRAKRRPRREDVSEHLTTDTDSPLQRVINRETLDAYEAALAKLPEQTREAVFLRLEFGMTYPEIADAVESPSANAVRMTISRALVQIAESMPGVQDKPE